MTHPRRSKDQIAALVAQDIPNGAYVNLGIGMPTMVANHLPAGLEIILHSENGILGMGPAPAEADHDFDLILIPIRPHGVAQPAAGVALGIDDVKVGQPAPQDKVS